MTRVNAAATEIASRSRESFDSEPEFTESLPRRLKRWLLGGAYALVPKRIGLLPRLLVLSVAHLLAPEAERESLPEDPIYYGKRGLVGISNDLSVEALLNNYRAGYFPVCHIGSMKWWCPEERAVIDPMETHVSKNLRRLVRQERFSITFDRDFAGVIAACAAPRPGKVPLTWITPRVMHAYWQAHQAGYAHSVEVWDDAGRLVGGLYGLAIGKVFFGESQFSIVEHTSKIALVALHRHLREWGYHVRDGKLMTPHLASFGFKPMPRATWQALLKKHVDEPGRIGRWTVDPRLDLTDWPARSPDPSVQLTRSVA